MYRHALRAILSILLATLVVGSAQAAEDSIKIGAVFAKTGAAASANLHHFQALRFAVDEVNAQGGLLGKQVELLEFDNASSAIQSKVAAKQAVRAGVVAVIGASWSDHSLAMAPYLQRAKIPMISPDSTNPDVTLKGDYIFRACFIDPFQGEALAKLATSDFNAKTAVVMQCIDSRYSMGLTKIFAEHFEKLGSKVLETFDYKQGNKDFRDSLSKVAKFNPDVLVLTGHVESGLIVRQAREQGVTSIILGGDGWDILPFLSQGGNELKEGYFTTHWSPDLGTPKSDAFVEKYQKSYGSPDVSVVMAYDAAMVLFDAIRRAGTPDPVKIRDALAATKGYDGVTGSITFDENGDPIKQVVVQKVEGGKLSMHKIIQP